MRELLRKFTAREIAHLPESDLQQAILNAMLERSRDRTGGFVYMNQPAAEIINNLAAMEDVKWPETKTLSEALERNIGRAFKKLLQDELIESALGFTASRARWSILRVMTASSSCGASCVGQASPRTRRPISAPAFSWSREGYRPTA